MTSPSEYGDRLRKEDYHVTDVSHAEALRLVQQWHYAGGMGAVTMIRHGLFRNETGELVGVAVWVPPIIGAARRTFPHDPHAVLALSRLVIDPAVPKNAATYLLARSVRLIKQQHPRWRCLVTYADEAHGHIGRIYIAAGWMYVGKIPANVEWRDEDGRMRSDKSGDPLTVREMFERGWSRSVARHAKHKYVKVL